jgi:hypothetical protein
MKLWHIYVVIGVVAFFATGSQILEFTHAGPVGGTIDFWDQAIHSSSASLFLTYDVVLLGLAVFILLWVEGQKVGISMGWRIAYIALSLFVGISTFVPFFLAHRQRKLDAQAS